MASYDSDKVAHIHDELHSHLPSEPALRAKSLESLLVDKGLLKADAVDKWLDNLAEKIGPKNGSRVIARSWVDPDFEATLRKDAAQAFKELGLADSPGYELKALFNTEEVHNLVVCTLCSCYPLRLIGMSPSWYKSNEYRARAVRDPRGVLDDFGVSLEKTSRSECGILPRSGDILSYHSGRQGPRRGPKISSPGSSPEIR